MCDVRPGAVSSLLLASVLSVLIQLHMFSLEQCDAQFSTIRISDKLVIGDLFQSHAVGFSSLVFCLSVFQPA